MIVNKCNISDFKKFLQITNFTRGDSEYIRNLIKIINDYESKLAIIETKYSLVSENGSETDIQFYDIKLKFSQKEDSILENMYSSWERLEKSDCPYRRGMCIGVVGETPFIAVGTKKFFYGTSKDFLKNDEIIISEKANGEFTMFTTITNKGDKWILVGSKNVRIILPISTKFNPKNIFKNLMSNMISDTSTIERYSFLETMIDIWVQKIKESSFLFVESEKYTFIGEQVGVHNHIYTNYEKKTIIIFGFIDKNGHSIDSHVRDLGKLKSIETVKTKKIKKENLENELINISAGSIEEYGEGSVIYCYNQNNKVNIYKYKNENYSFIRTIRTSFENFIGKLNKNPSEVVLNYYGESEKILNRIKTDERFPDVTQNLKDSWLSVIPRMVIFIIRHRLTFITSNFSHNFIRIYDYLCNNPEKYLMKNDDYYKEMKEISEIKIESKERPIVEIVKDLVESIVQEKPNIFAFSMKPGSGKTVLFKHIKDALITTRNFRNIKIFERDAYAKKYSEPQIINEHWYSDVKKFIKEPENLALVGNCFHKDYAMKFRQEMGKNSNRKMLVARLDEKESSHPDYTIICFKRLLNRNDTNNDGSTLTMSNGAYVVCNKFFNTNPVVLKNGISIVNFRSININDNISDFEEKTKKISDFENKFSIKKQLRKKMISSAVELTNKKKPILVGLEPCFEDLMYHLSDLGSDLLEKSDFHVTLKFKPTSEDLKTYKLSSKITLKGYQLITLTNKTSKDFIQFIPLTYGNTSEKYGEHLHVTLGTTDNTIMPCSLSFSFLQNPRDFYKDYDISIKEMKPIDYEGPVLLFY